jgi:ubiquinone/menaquinone biosynthesis C-methylase UbiE
MRADIVSAGRRNGSMSELERARQMYETKFRIDFRKRDYEWHPRNSISLVHAQLLEWQVVDALNKLDIELVDQRVLDVGCGYGRMLRFLAEMGAEPACLFGCDLALYRLQRARQLSSGLQLLLASAGQLPFPSATFDLVSQFSVFSSIFAAELRIQAAREMMRVLKPGGWLLWYDMALGSSATIQPIPQAEVLNFFQGLHVKYMRPIFSFGLMERIRARPRLAIIREHLRLGRKQGLLIVFQRPLGEPGASATGGPSR